MKIYSVYVFVTTVSCWGMTTIDTVILLLLQFFPKLAKTDWSPLYVRYWNSCWSTNFCWRSSSSASSSSRVFTLILGSIATEPGEGRGGGWLGMMPGDGVVVTGEFVGDHRINRLDRMDTLYWERKGKLIVSVDTIGGLVCDNGLIEWVFGRGKRIMGFFEWGGSKIKNP